VFVCILSCILCMYVFVFLYVMKFVTACLYSSRHICASVPCDCLGQFILRYLFSAPHVFALCRVKVPNHPPVLLL
jgi:hypothetical protein